MFFQQKKAGETMNDIITKIKKEKGYRKLGYCGRLDPMARGKVLLLVEEECKKMDYYMDTSKVYQFEIILGFQTDTDDPLGMIENTRLEYDFNSISSQIERNIKKDVFQQKFHKYSSKRFNGKPIFWYAQNNLEVELPTHQVEIKDIKILGWKEYLFQDWKQNIIKTIDKLDRKNNFRQDLIIEQWSNLDYKLIIKSCFIEICVSSGFYVRQFVRDLSNEIHFPLLTFDINRTEII